MKRKFLTFAACLFSVMTFAQQENEDSRLANIDWKEDSTEVTTINDIIKQQQELTSFNATEKHFTSVWSYRGYFNFTYNTTTLSPKEPIETGVSLNRGKVVDFKSDWGASIQYGRSYRLHKKPIANVAQFNIDYTGIDLNVNHFTAEGDKNLYDSNKKMYEGDKDKECYYTPWNLEKYEANYGMSIGPSLTLAPFTYINVPALHFLKFNVYYHIGYHVSVLYMLNDKKADVNQNESDGNYKTMSDNLKLDLGHGIINSFGVNMSWKAIGIGYEHRTGKLKYQSLTTKDFGKDKYDFNSTTNRVYIQIRM